MGINENIKTHLNKHLQKNCEAHKKEGDNLKNQQNGGMIFWRMKI